MEPVNCLGVIHQSIVIQLMEEYMVTVEELMLTKPGWKVSNETVVL